MADKYARVQLDRRNLAFVVIRTSHRLWLLCTASVLLRRNPFGFDLTQTKHRTGAKGSS
jgi:hypothetical protein